VPRKTDLWSERRRDRRVDAEISIALSPPNAVEPVTAATRNLSGSGAYITLDEPLPLFGRYHVHLLLPVVGADGQPEIEDIEVTAIVVRHSTLEEDGALRHCHALYFDNVHPRDRERIIEFVDTLYE
jgi:c-di-GMP-binding flagellar brake protein YcgR